MRRAFKIVSLCLVAILVMVLSFAAGFGTGTRVHADTPPIDPVAAQAQLGDQFKIFWEAWRIVERDFVDRKKLEAKRMTYGAIKGMLESLGDPYTGHIDPQAYKMEQQDLGGSFSGIGATVATENQQLIVVSPIEGSPAAAAGIKAGARILSVDGEDTSKMTLMEAVNKIRGPKGSRVRLVILQPGEKQPVTMEIVRDDIKNPSVTWKALPDNLAYLRITQFTARTSLEVKDALRQIEQTRPAGVVIDLRHNPGGLLDSVVDVSSQFLKDGVVLYQVDADGNRKAYDVRRGGLGTDLRLVVLVDKASASASEILAGALQDTGRAVVIGQETFGKGTVTQLHQLSDNSAVNVAIARWVTPKGNLIEGKGIAPDIVVERTDDDVAAGRDPQLDRAIEQLRNGS